MATWEVYFQIIPILNAMYMQVMQAMWILAKALLATYVSWSQEIQYLGKDEYKHLLLYPSESMAACEETQEAMWQARLLEQMGMRIEILY